jgi:diaminopimelate decarboxylase
MTSFNLNQDKNKNPVKMHSLSGEFRFNSNSELCMGDVALSSLLPDLINTTDNYDDKKQTYHTPLFLYSKNKLLANFLAYKNSFLNISTTSRFHISYSLKANFNPSILKIFQENGSWCSLVNKNELLLALKCNFRGEHLIFNGNGKTLEEIELAIKSKCYLNIDSLFNLKHTIKVCKKLANAHLLDEPVKIVIRINQLINARVHQYLSTSVHTCKFGIIEDQLQSLIEIILDHKHLVKLVGFHTHLGSTIRDVNLYDESVKHLIAVMKMTREKYGIETIDFLNFGGGLGIDYEKFSHRTMKENEVCREEMIKPHDLAKVISKYAEDLANLQIVVEPGRSLVGDTCILLTHLMGVKINENRKFLVCDASMCECIRPCLYDAYHHIDYVTPLKDNEVRDFVDVVGPVCESGDFLGKNRYMQIPSEDSLETKPIYMAIMVSFN